MGIGPHYVDIPFSAWLFLPALMLLFALREWGQVKRLLFFLPTSLTALLLHRGARFQLLLAAMKFFKFSLVRKPWDRIVSQFCLHAIQA